jgi:uncharacterized protein YlzI (FlbEa/FlbD family)
VWELLIITLLDGREAHINPREIVSIMEAKEAEDPGKHFTSEVKCVVSMTDGKMITTKEDCDNIDARLHEMVKRHIRELRK